MITDRHTIFPENAAALTCMIAMDLLYSAGVKSLSSPEHSVFECEISALTQRANELRESSSRLVQHKSASGVSAVCKAAIEIITEMGKKCSMDVNNDILAAATLCNAASIIVEHNKNID